MGNLLFWKAPHYEAITEPVTLGKDPHWDCAEQVLYFVSIYDGTVHKYVPATGTHTSSTLGEEGNLSFIIPIEGKQNRFTVGFNRKVIEIEWTGEPGAAKVVRTIVEVEQDKPKNILNASKPDPRGRLFTGSMNHGTTLSNIEPKQGSVYRIDHDGSVHKLDDGITLSNGLAWDLKARAFYYIDTMERSVRQYDYDELTGNISKPKRIFDYNVLGLQGYPYGMTIDIDGNLWVASILGHEIINLDPRTGKLLKKIHFPVSKVTAVAFGGSSMDVLYVTTGKSDGEQKHSGSLFKVTGLGVRGRTNMNVKIS